MFELCAPALIYIAFSLTQVIIDTFKGLYNTAFFKFIVMIVITFLLNALCKSGMSIISWIIVFIPFIFMSVIVAILLYVFGLDAATGTLNFKCNPDESEDETKNKSGNLIYSTTYTKPIKNSTVTRAYVDTSYSETPSEVNNYNSVPAGSSDPQYESFESN
jgi:predicted membrane protein